jgi:hypothetical protein
LGISATCWQARISAPRSELTTGKQGVQQSSAEETKENTLKTLPDIAPPLPVRSVFDMPADMYEASLARVHDFIKHSSLVILSVFRSADERLAEENAAAHGELMRKVAEHGFGYTQMKGRYIENRGRPEERRVVEKLLLVTAGSDPRTHERLIAMAKHLARHFDQDSVLFKPYTDENAYLLGTTKRGFVDPPFGQTKLVGKFHPNKVGDYMVMLRRHHRGGLTSAFGENAPEDSMKVVFLRQRSFFSRWNTPGYDDRIF